MEELWGKYMGQFDTPPPLNNISTIVGPQRPIPHPPTYEGLQLAIGHALLKIGRAMIWPFLTIGAKRRREAEASRLRWLQIRKFQETPEMTQAQADKYFFEKSVVARGFGMSVNEVNEAFIRLHKAAESLSLQELPTYK